MTKPKFPRADALDVAKELCAALKPGCEPGRLIVAGSLRRRKQLVGDVELVYVARCREQTAPNFDLFTPPRIERLNEVDELLARLLEGGLLRARLDPRGSHHWGPQNKFALHAASGIPVDLFSTYAHCWFNYLVCRTGGWQFNRQIAMAAQARGWKWHPTGDGFESLANRVWHRVTSERDLFDFLGLAYLEPWQRP